MKRMAKEIIPDISLTSDAEVGLNLYGARHMLNNLLCEFNRIGMADRDCLYEILQMDLDRARAFIEGDSSTNDDRASLNPADCDKVGQIFATMQMMLHAYLCEQMVIAA